MNRQLGSFKTSPNLSSETLFHFTSSFNTLELILKNGFQTRWIYEKLPGGRLAYFTKTTCFCDIPLGLIKEHVNWYGTYGIGINRPVAKNYGLSPIIYLHSKSPIFPRGSSESSVVWFKEFKLTSYLKQVRGLQMFFNDLGDPFWKWKTFYNEREWRYFPPKNETYVVKYKKETELEEKLKELNNVDNFPHFNIKPEWIEYILINNPNEIEGLIKILDSDNFKPHFNNLLTKVITFSQLRKDF